VRFGFLRARHGSLARRLLFQVSRDGNIEAPPALQPEHQSYPKKEGPMLYYAIVFLIIAVIAGAFGFFGVAGLAATIAKVLFVVFLILFIVSLIFGRKRV
jgi:uncharacterized membrane protein YtjA (UPF0391 family)